VTRIPAEILHLGKRVGSLEAGKDGNVVLFSGDPLSITSSVQFVVIEGRQVYDRSKDIRARHLLEGIEQDNTAPGGVTVDAHPHDDGPDEKPDEEKKKDAGEKKQTEDKDKDKHDAGGKQG
jgi:hypothetical protein